MDDSPQPAMEALYQDALLLWMNDPFSKKRKRKKKEKRIEVGGLVHHKNKPKLPNK